MLVCPKCNIEYEEGKKFCRKCGSFLLSEDGSTFELSIMESAELRKTEENLFCPKCKESYKKGRYCRKCGSLLVQKIQLQAHDVQCFEEKIPRRLEKRWLRFPFPPPLITASVIILLATMGGYFLWQKYDQKNKLIQPPLPSPLSLIDSKETEEIKFLFETIKQANLKKNIDLFMSCYSLDFKDRKRKKLDTLENWEQFHYLDLKYSLKKQTILRDIATVRVEWLMKISPKGTGKPEDSKTVLDVVLKREEDRWKIKEIKPMG
jgi:uncharacterized membrane protein YvbJ